MNVARFALATVLLSSLSMMGCAAANEEAKSAGDPWSGFKGTYSTPAAPREKGDETSSTSSKKEAAKKAKAAEAKEEESTDGDVIPPMGDAKADKSAKKSSKGMIKGESASTVSVDALTDATKGFKQKFVGNGVVTGPEFETVSVELKGVKVIVVRPASTPNASGPAVLAPKAKKAELSKNDASWYDEEADVLVGVTGCKTKAGCQKVLNSIVKH